jgi:hypothetical protein
MEQTYFSETPVQRRWAAALANALRTARDYGNKVELPEGAPLVGGLKLGDMILGQAPEGAERLAYGERMTSGRGQTLKIRPETLDLAMLTPIPGGGQVGMAARSSGKAKATSKALRKAPQDSALEIARQNAVKMLGLPENNTAAERAAAMGYEDFLHGTQRLDRLLDKRGIDAKRATSGPMPYGTNSPELASNYAKNKADTSRIASDEGDVRQYFQVAPKQLGFRGTAPYSVEQSWNYLPQEVRADILDKSRRVGYENLDEFSGPLTLHPLGTDATLSASKFDWDMKNSARGNPLAALRDMWHDSGELIDSPEDLATIYKLAGYPHEISQTNAPWFTSPGVLTGKARITNPLDTTDAKTLTEVVIPALKDAFKNDKTRLKIGSDAWDKNSRFTPKDWVQSLETDLSKGDNSYVWTSIPDKVTDQLRKLGYNGIIDRSGKGGGSSEKVVIPFDPGQVRSRFAAFDPAKTGENDLLAFSGKSDVDVKKMMADEGRKALVSALRSKSKKEDEEEQ